MQEQTGQGGGARELQNSRSTRVGTSWWLEPSSVWHVAVGVTCPVSLAMAAAGGTEWNAALHRASLISPIVRGGYKRPLPMWTGPHSYVEM